MPKFKALTPIEHNGKRYETDKVLDLSDEEAEPLLAVNAIEPAGKKTAEEGKAEGGAK